MFTGIVEEVGKVLTIQQQRMTCQLTLRGQLVMEGLKLGDSLAVNGVCLTVSKIMQNSIQLDVMEETRLKTTLGRLQAGNSVNLERAMPAMGRFGGHYVSGHVDVVGNICGLSKLPGSILLTIEIPIEWLHYMVEKGSITIDGVSLTLIQVERRNHVMGQISVGIIPHTQKATILTEKKVGEQVNIEVDLLAKYMEKWLKNNAQETLTQARLSQLGY